VSTRLKLLALALVLLALQQLVASTLPESFRPDFLLVLALALGLRSSATGALLLAFALGFAVDLLSGSPTGTYALLRGTACALTRLADRTLYLRSPLPWAAYSAAYQGVDFLFLGAIAALLLPQGGADWTGLLARAPGSMVATGLVALPLAAAFQRWGLTPTQRTGPDLRAPARSRL
jgi:rod shape-determining protein MreD